MEMKEQSGMHFSSLFIGWVVYSDNLIDIGDKAGELSLSLFVNLKIVVPSYQIVQTDLRSILQLIQC